MRRGGFTLIEAVATIALLATAIPPALFMLDDAVKARHDSLNNTRAVWLTTAVLEHVIADAQSSSPGMGIEALTDPNTYLNTAGTGLYARLTPHLSLYTSLGFTYSVNISPLVGYDGVATGDPLRDLYHYVQVTAMWSSSKGAQAQMVVSELVTDL